MPAPAAETRADPRDEMITEAAPDGDMLLTVVSLDDAFGIVADLTAIDATARVLVAGLGKLLSEPRYCGVCDEVFDCPAAIAVLHADRPGARAGMLVGCCEACTAGDPAALRPRLLAFVGTLFEGARAIDPIDAAPGVLQ